MIRVLESTDKFCPKCGHNRDESSTSSIDHEDGTHSCQFCNAKWLEPLTEPAIITTWRNTGFWPQVVKYVDALKAYALRR